MKKQRKQFLILLLILVALVGGYFGLRYYNANAVDEEMEAEEYIVEIPDGSIQRIAYTYEGEEYAFIKEEDIWKFEADTSLNITQSTIQTMESRGENLTMVDKIEGVTDFAQYGLDMPERQISFETADGVYTFQVGDYNSFSYGYYICQPDSDTVYLVESSVLTAFNKHPEDMIDAEEEETEESLEAAEGAVTE